MARIGKERILHLQKELFDLGVLEEFKDYKISEKYLSDFLDMYSKKSGQYSYVIGAIIIPLFKSIKEKHPAASEEEITKKCSELAPIIRAMLQHEGVFRLIKKVSE